MTSVRKLQTWQLWRQIKQDCLDAVSVLHCKTPIRGLYLFHLKGLFGRDRDKEGMRESESVTEMKSDRGQRSL